MQILPYSPVHRTGIIDCFRSNIPKSFTRAEESDFLDFVESGKGTYFVGLAEGTDHSERRSPTDQVIACAGIAFRGDVGDLCWGLVHADWQGRGLGAQLLAHRLRVMLERPIKTIRLETSQHTETFFARYGFRVAERVANGYAPGLDTVEMTAPVSELRIALARLDAID
jgi:predicted GNAT family N-acyltransferase